MGIITVPVIHNMRPAWLDAPSAYHHANVPYVIAVADAVAVQLRESGCVKPIVTIRHELQRWFQPEVMARGRREIRDRHGINDSCLLIGMVGQFKSQKAYTRAVRVLAEVQKHYTAKLMILGDWDHEYGSGRTTYEATCRLALELGVMADLIMPGNIHPVEPYFGAFDVYLNTSVYEGFSIALLEAVQAGCPVVVGDAGGNREAISDSAILVEDPSDIASYAEGILQLAIRRSRSLPSPPIEPDLIPRLWALLAKHCNGRVLSQSRPLGGTLFVTEGLHTGGPARSLTSLLCRLPRTMKTALCVMDGISIAIFDDMLRTANVPVLDLAATPSIVDKTDQLLSWLDQLDIGSLCFWNVRPETKLLIAKLLFVRKTRLIDVSPGPMLFDELQAAAPFQRRIAMPTVDYLARLDHFVSLYHGGLPKGIGTPRRSSVIPLGVAVPPRFVPLPPATAMLSPAFDPLLAIGTCCRIVPDKKIEFLFEMMGHVQAAIPGASLTIVGAPDSQSQPYFRMLKDRVATESLASIHFAGSHEDVTPFLSQFRVFVMVSDRQGCPNASLEAMAMGLPVVTNLSGGTAEQIEDGVNGFLADDSRAMAHRVIELLANPQQRRIFGDAGRARARARFSIDDMVRRFGDVLTAEETTLDLGAPVLTDMQVDLVRGPGLMSVAGGRQ